MQSKATKNTPAPNARQKRFQNYTKNSDCIVCGNSSPSIVHHCMGKSYRHNKVLIGHDFVIPLCKTCDDIITIGSRRKFKELFGFQNQFWEKHLNNHIEDCNELLPSEIIQAIEECNE